MASQFFEAAKAQATGLLESLAEGDYAPLRTWLTKNVYQHGRTYLPEELLARTTGQGLEVAPYLGYLNEKYGALYEL
jgi:carboxypeptidase Taq